ncbi:unnamed protein product [Meganyctiphanes norvegica]|uniref:Glutathione S-transferase n=1 Tax=Meganyctiphanes norvegica TaxID=48144 RepID=A0AAV2RPY1_MEGNR
MTKPVLGYWGIRGMAQHIRLLLEYTGTEFEDKQYIGSPDYVSSAWFEEKTKLGLDFPNLPYYMDGDLKLTQSNAIMRYLAQKHNLCGTTDTERSHCDMLTGQAYDFRMKYNQLCYYTKFMSKDDLEAAKKEYVEEKLPGMLKEFSDFLSNRKWFIGDKIRYVDFILYELFDMHRLLDPKCLQDYQNLIDFQDRFEALEQIKTYRSSSRFMKIPPNAPFANFQLEYK